MTQVGGVETALRLRFGIVIDATAIDAWKAATLDQLARSGVADLALVVIVDGNRGGAPRRPRPRPAPGSSMGEKLGYAALHAFATYVSRSLALRPFDGVAWNADVATIRASRSPTKSPGMTFRADDLEKIRVHRLDFLLWLHPYRSGRRPAGDRQQRRVDIPPRRRGAVHRSTGRILGARRRAARDQGGIGACDAAWRRCPRPSGGLVRDRSGELRADARPVPPGYGRLAGPGLPRDPARRRSCPAGVAHGSGRQTRYQPPMLRAPPRRDHASPPAEVLAPRTATRRLECRGRAGSAGVVGGGRGDARRRVGTSAQGPLLGRPVRLVGRQERSRSCTRTTPTSTGRARSPGVDGAVNAAGSDRSRRWISAVTFPTHS